MKVRVLGSAAGGGLPQWNCGCRNCLAVRRGDPRIRARTEESVAISTDGERWFVLNAAPEIRAQIESFPPLQPREARHSPIEAIFLTNGDLDHCLGLLSLRESQRLSVYATESVRRGFVDDNVLYRTLERFPGQVTWRALVPDERVALRNADGDDSGLTVLPVAVPGKLPVHLERLHAETPGDNVGLSIRDENTGRTLAYFPGVASATASVKRALADADCVFFDGTFWSNDELVILGLGTKRAVDMAHWPLGGSDGSLRLLAEIPRARRVLIHVNNTNPILYEDSDEARFVRESGVEIAWDGMEFEV
jgi:pyrroloquinoline quinone biosynthesis protein B